MSNANAAAIGLSWRRRTGKPLAPLGKLPRKTGRRDFCRKKFKKLRNRC
jgi:hypothetical protein